MGTTMITLVGGRIPPIVAIAAKQYENLSDVYFLVSKDSASTYERLVNIFEREFSHVRLHHIGQDGSSWVNPFDKKEISEKCKNILRTLANNSTVVQLTSGTQVMCVGAYEAAKEFDVPAIYVNTAGGEILDLLHDTKQPITSNVKVCFYCAIYGFEAKPDKLIKGLTINKQQAIDLSKELVTNFKVHLRLVNKLRRARKGRKASDFFTLPNLNNSEREILDILIKQNLIQEKCGQIRVFSSNWEYITAKWLEVFTYDCAKNQINFFDDCQLSVQLENEADCDVICIRRGIPLILECKTGGNVILSDLKAIVDKSNKIGGNYCMKAIIHTGLLTLKTKSEKDKLRIECLELEELKQNPGFLKDIFLKLIDSMR